MTLLAADALLYNGIPRWSFGLDSPNKAAAVLAFVLVLLLAASLRARLAWVRWCCGALAAAAGYGLVHTFSRGGMVAFLAGAAVLLVGLRREPRGLRRWLPALAAAVAIAAAAAWLGFAGRMARSSPSSDASVGNRLVMWRNVPAMMADAPGGWGRGAAGDAFMCWYQPLERGERYRTLVNSHFTWLVEFGWAGRMCYICGMALLFVMGAARLRARGDPVPLAVLASFAVAAFFSSVAEEWTVCLIPLAVAVPMLRTFFRDIGPRLRFVAVVSAVIAGGLLLGGAAVAGTVCRPAGMESVHRSFDGTRIVLGEGAPSAWAVADPEVMGGPSYGRLLRKFAQTADGRGRAYGIASDLAAVPADVRRLALIGSAADAGAGALERFASLSDVRVISPNRPDVWLAARAVMPCIRVFCGEFSRSCPAEDAEGMTVVTGAAEYIHEWPRLAFADCR